MGPSGKGCGSQSSSEPSNRLGAFVAQLLLQPFPCRLQVMAHGLGMQLFT
jgi:hypothetical protein